MSARLATLAYEFREPALLDMALTHRSAGGFNNERLEFLGDAVLSLVIAEWLYQTRPRASEGELSRLRASLVNQESLASIARSLQLGDALNLGSGELKSGGFRRDSILADALEAVFGAVYLDGGFVVCCRVIRGLYESRMSGLPTAADLKDPKTRLQEYLQARQQALPAYNLLEVSGEAHAQRFTVECVVGDQHRGVATANSRRKAEQEAARLVLERVS